MHNQLSELLQAPYGTQNQLSKYMQDSYTLCSSQNRPSEPLPVPYTIYSTLNQPFEPLLKTHALNLLQACYMLRGSTSFAVVTMYSSNS